MRRVDGYALVHAGDEVLEAELVDVSLGGVQLHLPDGAAELAEHARVHLQINLLEHGWIEVDGEVLVPGPGPAVVVFSAPTADQLRTLARIVAKGFAVTEAPSPEAARPDTLDHLPGRLVHEVPQPETSTDYLPGEPGPAHVTTSSRRVLVVDDDDDLRELLVGVLRAAGHQAEGAGDGCDALDLLRADPGRYSLILLDYVMPRMDGHEFRLAQQADPALAGIPVIVTSGAPLRDLPSLDADVEMRKPLSQHALLDAIDSVRMPN